MSTTNLTQLGDEWGGSVLLSMEWALTIKRRFALLRFEPFVKSYDTLINIINVDGDDQLLSTVERRSFSWRLPCRTFSAIRAWWSSTIPQQPHERSYR
jgi:hypothetical protein